MKAFFEEYGLVILVALVVMILVIMATPIGTVIQTSLTKFVNDFATGIGTWIDDLIHA